MLAKIVDLENPDEVKELLHLKIVGATPSKKASLKPTIIMSYSTGLIGLGQSTSIPKGFHMSRRRSS
jgi:hypothetical protein